MDSMEQQISFFTCSSSHYFITNHFIYILWVLSIMFKVVIMFCFSVLKVS